MEFFVATDGSDSHPGTKEKPFLTVHRARDAVRGLKKAGPLPDGGVTIQIRGGVHYLGSPLLFGPDDAGTSAAPIVYRSYENETAWLNGGKPIDSGSFAAVTDPEVLARLESAAREHVVQLDMEAAGMTNYIREVPVKFSGFTRNNPLFMELFCNGKRMQVARWPNDGFAHFDKIIDHGSGLVKGHDGEWPGTFSYTGDRPERWNVDEGADAASSEWVPIRWTVRGREARPAESCAAPRRRYPALCGF